MLCAEQFCLRVLWELDQLETDWMGCMESKDPEAVAAACRMFGHHLQLTMKHLGAAMVVTEAELELGCPQRGQQGGMPTGMPTEG